jgi:uncharacterized protein YegJ (DUF2314 family)
MKKDKFVKRDDEPDLVNVPGDDEKMNWAIEKAQLTLWYFENAIKNPHTDELYYSVKAKIVDGEEVEHLWLTNPGVDDQGIFYGLVGNVPVYVKTVKFQSRIGIPREQVSDWMIVDKGRLIGGYTLRAIRDGYTEKERQEFDESVGLLIDNGIDYFKHDFETPEGAILCLEDSYEDKNIEKAVICKDFIEEAKSIVEKLESIPNDDLEIIKQTAEVLELSFIKSLKDNGFPSFKDITRSFEREKISENKYIITETCTFPDFSKSIEKLVAVKGINGWRVASIIN